MTFKLVANDFFNLTKNIRNGADVTAALVTTARASAEAAKATHFIQSIVPLHIAPLIRAPLDLILMGQSFYQTYKAPSYLKFLPLMSILESSGNILDYFTSAVWITKHAGINVSEAITTACTPITGAAIGLQAIGVAILAWKIFNIFNVLNTAESKNTNLEKLSTFTAIPKGNKIAKYKQKFFSVLDENHIKTITSIIEKNSKNPDDNLAPTFDLVKKRHIEKAIETTAQIALLILGIVGVALVVFAGIATAGWGIIAAGAIASLGLIAYKSYTASSFNSALQNHLN